MKIIILSTGVEMTPENAHERNALERLRVARSVTVQSLDPWGKADDRVLFQFPKDDWGT